MSGQHSVLIVDDNATQRAMLRRPFDHDGWAVSVARSAEEALQMASAHQFELALIDWALTGATTGDQVAHDLLEVCPLTRRVLITGESIESPQIREVVHSGLFEDVLSKPFTLSDIIALRVAADVVNQEMSEVPNILTLASAKPFGEVYIGGSQLLRRTLVKLGGFAPSDRCVHLEGPTGVGKTVFAEYVHVKSGRHSHSYSPIDLNTLSSNLIETELFGSLKGGFTQAANRPGRIRQAGRGTAFLDEIGTVPIDVQPRLLTLLDGWITRVGSDDREPVLARLITASNKNLKRGVSNKTFRKDLYFRVRGLSVQIPSLQQRVSDIPDLASWVVEKWNIRYKRSCHLDRFAVQALTNDYDWPGNVRELVFFLERLVLEARSDRITARAVLKSLVAQEKVLVSVPQHDASKSGDNMVRRLPKSDSGAAVADQTIPSRLARCKQQCDIFQERMKESGYPQSMMTKIALEVEGVALSEKSQSKVNAARSAFSRRWTSGCMTKLLSSLPEAEVRRRWPCVVDYLVNHRRNIIQNYPFPRWLKILAEKST